MKLLLQADLSEDLSKLTQTFWKQGIVHRVFEKDGYQLLVLGDEKQVEYAEQLLAMWRAGDALPVSASDAGAMPSELAHKSSLSKIVNAITFQCRHAPITLALLITMAVIAAYTELGSLNTVLYFLVVSPELLNTSSWVFADVFSTPIWRWLTPIFLHFSALHLIFNGLWLWELGKKIEYAGFGLMLVLLVVVSGITANLAQLLDTGPVFGGMSGVVYALLAYSWLSQRFYPERGLMIPSAVMNFMLAWLVLGYTGFSEVVGLGKMANTAHLAGLLSGFVFCFCERILRGAIKSVK